jgi:tRNA (guanine37-N1)-methyltransferase
METEKTIGIRVPIQQAETIRRYLSQNALLRTELKISKNHHFIYFPLNKIPEDIPFSGTTIIRKEFEQQKRKQKPYKETIALPEKLRHELPTSYDVIGDIILIKLPKHLLKYKTEIGNALLTTNKNVHVVCLANPVSGELRTRNIEILAGEKRTRTTHIEYGATFAVDIQTTYFSPRLATERKRIADLVQPGETVVDMFAGVAPFSIMIAKYAHPTIVYAVDKNKDAIAYAHQNIKRNKVLDKVEVIHADAKKFHTRLPAVYADRIIMNLPFSAHMFFPYALQIAADTCTIHYYDILNEENIPGRIDRLKDITHEHNMTFTSTTIRKIKTYSPREFYMGIDIRTKRTPM